MMWSITRIERGKNPQYRIQTTDNNGTPLYKYKKLRTHIGELLKKYGGKYIVEEVVEDKGFLDFSIKDIGWGQNPYDPKLVKNLCEGFYQELNKEFLKDEWIKFMKDNSIRIYLDF